MKRYILVFLILLLTTGCSKTEKIQCRYENKTKENEYVSVMNIQIKNNLVVNAKVTMTYQDLKMAQAMCKVFKMTSDAKGNLKCRDKVITLKNYHKSLSEKLLEKDKYLEIVTDRKYICQ